MNRGIYRYNIAVYTTPDGTDVLRLVIFQINANIALLRHGWVMA